MIFKNACYKQNYYIKTKQEYKNIKIYFLSQLEYVIINNLFNFLKTSPIYVKV